MAKASVRETIPRWRIKVDYIETCNCNYACPCNFNGYPTDGYCEALLRFPKRTPIPPLFVPLSYFSNASITNQEGSPAEVLLYPFGRPEGPYAPVKKISQILRPSDAWAITDADQQNVPTGATYYEYIPREPVHGSKRPALRNYLYFDWSVRANRTDR